MIIAQTLVLDWIFWIGAVLFLTAGILTRRLKRAKYALPVIPLIVMTLFAVVGQWTGVRDFINWMCRPEYLLIFSIMWLVVILVFYKKWTHPLIAALLFAGAILVFVISAFDPNFYKIIDKPDNIAVVLMILLVGFFIWLALRRMSINDLRLNNGELPAEGRNDDQVLVWPDLVYVELILIVLCTVVMMVWSMVIRAPLEAPANPHVAPNPAKAPWYFLGLQELLVYFDPWIAGVALPCLIVFGLCALPYLDRNPKGNGYYTLTERPIVIPVFLFGFIVIWLLPIIIGVFLRGPNWRLYGPFEYWDPHLFSEKITFTFSELFWTFGHGKPVSAANAGASSWFPLLREAPGLVILGLYFLLTPWLLKRTIFRKMYAEMGRSRFAIMSFLLICMSLVPIKMLLRWLFCIKYLVAFPEWNFSI